VGRRPHVLVTRNLAVFNLVVQLVLILGVFVGAYLGRTRRFSRHCLLMRLLMSGQILLIAIVMAPQLGRYLSNWSGFSAFIAVLILHHVLGLAALALWIYINLAMAGTVRAPHRYTWLMWSALTTWAASLALGAYVFWYIWR
jgi:hypothetical protein